MAKRKIKNSSKITHSSDFLIIGGGIAGLSAAIEASKYGSVTIITKSKIGQAATSLAQGGIAVAMDVKQDSPLYHYEDTLIAGAGLCDDEAVKILVTEGILRAKELIGWGAQFDRAETEGGGKFALGLEAAHKQRRILHAGDETGKEIERTLGRKVVRENLAKIYQETIGIELIKNRSGRVIGALAQDKSEKRMVFLAKAVILATGGLGQIYFYTTNPKVATGDGIALAYNAGATVTDLEFIQFHPTSLVHSRELEDIVALPRFLISEAVRGEGGKLYNIHGVRFMPKYHSLKELAPRDIVSRAIASEMERTKSNHVLLDISAMGAAKIKKRFPHIYKSCLERGLDITKERIPVAPAAHYSMGGVKTDYWGQTTLAGLYAAGETASLGVHGANRLASNSLLDGLVYGHRSARAAALEIRKDKVPTLSKKELDSALKNNSRVQITDETIRQFTNRIRSIMWRNVGINRNEAGIKTAITKLHQIGNYLNFSPRTFEEAELQNLALVSRLVAKAALDRKESRGAHYRTDSPKTDDKHWKKHLCYRKQ
jgi:L-aspartate oxidase